MTIGYTDRVLETSTTTGTGAYTLAGALTGYRTFAAGVSTTTCPYFAFEVDANGNPSGGWEVGIGTPSGSSLARTSILSSSNANAAVSWAAGTRRVASGIPADAATQILALGLGTMATQNANAVAITGGTGALTSLSLNGYASTGVLRLNGGDNSSTFANPQIVLGYNGGSGQYAHYIHSRHNNAAANNAIDFYTGDGTSGGVYPTNAVLGFSINNGKVAFDVAVAPAQGIKIEGALGVGIVPLSTFHVSGSMSVGDSTTTGAIAQAGRVLNLIDTSAVLNITRISADSTTASPSMEFKHSTSAGGTIDVYWDFFASTSGFFIRNRNNSNATPLVVYDQAADGLLMLTSTGIGIGTAAPTEMLNFTATGNIGWTAGGADLIMGRAAAATLRLGGNDAASPVAQTFRAQGARAGTDSNTGGANLTLSSGPGTGTGTLSVLNLASMVAVGSGTGVQTMTAGLAIKAGTAVLTNYTVANLPAAGTAGSGATAFVTDANATFILGLGLTVAGGGANKVPVYSDGTNWIIG